MALQTVTGSGVGVGGGGKWGIKFSPNRSFPRQDGGEGEGMAPGQVGLQGWECELGPGLCRPPLGTPPVHEFVYQASSIL